jgi:hypothetical protein
MDSLSQWAERERAKAQSKENSHEQQADRFNKGHFRLGIATTVTTAIVGTAVFSNLAAPENSRTVIFVATGVLSVAAIVLAALQTFLGFADDAAKHKAAAVSFGAAARKIDLVLLYLKSQPPPDEKEAIKELENVSALLESIESRSPILPKARAKATGTS